MPTTKTRINISADRDMEWAIKKLAKADNMPVAAKAAELIRTALELEEDLVLAELAEKRSKENIKYVSHKDAWKNIE